MDDDILVFNGIDGSTGRPSWPALRCAQLVRAILAQADPANLLDLRNLIGWGKAGDKPPRPLDKEGKGLIGQ